MNIFKLSFLVLISAFQVSNTTSMEKVGYLEGISRVGSDSDNVFQKVICASDGESIAEINQRFRVDEENYVQDDQFCNSYTMYNKSGIENTSIFFHDEKCTYSNRLEFLRVVLFARMPEKSISSRCYICRNLDKYKKLSDLIKTLDYTETDIDGLYPYIAYRLSDDTPLMLNESVGEYVPNNSSILINLTNKYISSDLAKKTMNDTWNLAIRCVHFCGEAKKEDIRRKFQAHNIKSLNRLIIMEKLSRQIPLL